MPTLSPSAIAKPAKPQVVAEEAIVEVEVGTLEAEAAISVVGVVMQEEEAANDVNLVRRKSSNSAESPD